MKNKLITECTDKELLNNEKKLKIMTILLGVFMVLLFFATMVLTIKKGFTPIVIVPICLLPLFIIGMMNWKRVNKEKERRNLQ